MRLLVEDLKSVPAKPNDPNQYQEGWLPSTDPDRPHRVVLALLPQDSTGNASAVCADLFHSYPGLECVVMCGIAGGIPNLDDPAGHVRLGDIVVADEIIPYGHIRHVDGAEILRRPTGGRSSDLARAVNELRIGDLAGHRPWRAWLDGTDGRLAEFRRPPGDTDILYVAGKPVSQPDPALSRHEDRWPKVHHGPVGSADVLMRDEDRRDRLAAQYRLLAVEMEASGIASAAVLRNRSWFVVRGIVDYCEGTGKNDTWHLYGALAAAAYVRALLAACQPFGPAGAGHEAVPRSAIHKVGDDVADGGEPRTSRASRALAGRRRIWAAIAALIAALAILMTPLISQRIEEWRDPLVGVGASIDSPGVDGAIVPYCSVVSGSASGLSADRELWFVIQQPNPQEQPGEFYLITPIPVGGDGRWRLADVLTGDGRETGRPFWFQVYLTDKKVTSLLRREDYVDANMPVLPRGFLDLLHERPVRRGDYNREDC